MIYDDRLDTVLRNKPVAGEAGYIQYLQLIDLLGRRADGPSIPEEALDRLAELEQLLPAEQRALILAGSAPVLRHAELVLRLASQGPPIAATAFAAARLADATWAALIPELPADARACLRRRNDLGPLAQQTLARHADEEAAALGEAAPAPSAGAQDPPEGIAAIIQRIEALRRSRGAEASAASAAERPSPAASATAERLPPVAAVAFVSDAAGAIVRADHDCGPMLVGLTLGRRGPAAPARCDPGVVAAMTARGPIVAGRLVVDGAPRIAGAWRIDAAPRFDPASGGFIGYAGLLRRPARPRPRDASAAEEGRVEALQALHELRTPLNAIVGFAEFIHQQLLGPAPHRYVGHAANIAADAAQILAALEDVGGLVSDRRDDSLDRECACDGAGLTRELVRRLESVLAAQHIGFDLDADEPSPIALGEASAGRLLWRLLAALADAAAPGERLRLTIAAESGHVALTAQLPETWIGCDEAALLAGERPAADPPATSSLLGGGFALRLTAAEASRVGGSLLLGEDRLVLRLPRALSAELAEASHAAHDEPAVA